MLMEMGYGRFCPSPPQLNVNTKQLSKLKAGMSVSYGSEWISAVLCPSSAVCQSPAGVAAVSLKATLKPLVSDLHQTTLKRINGSALQLSVNYNSFLGSLLVYKTTIYIWEGPQQEIHNRTFNPWRAWKGTLLPRAERHPNIYNDSTWNSTRTHSSFSRASSLHKWQQPITQLTRRFFKGILKIIFKIQWICKIKIALIALTCYFKK